MNNKLGNIGAGFLSLALVLAAGTTFALPDQAKVFGIGEPLTADDLPPGLMRNKLKSLPEKARGQALQWLQGFSFAEADLQTLRIDWEGGVFYADTYLPEPGEGAAAESLSLPEAIAPADIFLLHSRPDATKVVYLDFDGHTITGTAWNSYVGTDPLVGKPFDRDGIDTAFNADELAIIGEIWHRVAEDMAPFDIDVTTEEPASFNSTTGRLLFTTDTDANGAAMPAQGAGGVAYVNVFGGSSYHSRYSPALVYYNHLGDTSSAEAGTHEFGHNLGLSHDGKTDGTEYYIGHGSGAVSWAPIMGAAYYRDVTQWSMGEYTGANQPQDDLAIIDGKLGYRADDHGDTLATASALFIEADGNVLVSNPETDPHNIYPDNKGIIEHRTDVDVFYLDVGAGPLSLTVTPAWDAFYRDSRRGANLDVEISLYDVNDTLLAIDDPLDETDATIATSVSAGRYYLLIDGVGNDVGQGYTDYGSLGEYFISGNVTPAAADTTPPTPDPMTWDVTPVATGENSITMTATTATDDSGGPVQYNFECTNAGCSDSGWQASPTYNSTGLAPATSYSYRVAARDAVGNTTAYSTTESATTDAPPPNIPPTASFTFSTSDLTASFTDSSNDSDGTLVTWLWDFGDGDSSSAQNPSHTYGSAGTYSVTLTVTDNDGGTGTVTDDSVTVTDPPPPPPYVDYLATGETLVAGTVSGSYLNTRNDDGSTESITERDSGGKPSKRYSYLEHIWHFDVSPGAVITLSANAWSSGSSEGDNFVFAYSLNGGSYTDMFEISSIDSTNLQTYSLPANTNGTVSVRVRDTDRTPGRRNADTVYVDYLAIRSETVAGDPPAAPSLLSATAISSSQINLAWTDNATDESGFKVERSTDGLNWAQIGTPGADAVSYSDTNLSASSTYYYQVAAYNGSGTSVYSDPASATTLPGADISLDATSYKVRAVRNVDLSWSGVPAESDVDIYRDGGYLVTTPNNGSYTDVIGKKGNDLYFYEVCESGSTSNCSDPVTVTF